MGFPVSIGAFWRVSPRAVRISILRLDLIFFFMANERAVTRSWRYIAKELAREIDPVKARALFDELSRAIRFVRYEDLDKGPSAPSAPKRM